MLKLGMLALMLACILATLGSVDLSRLNFYNGDIWVPHPLPVLKEPHLLAGRTRIVGSAGAIVVSTESRPTGDSPLSLELRAGDGAAEYVRFDGVSAAHLQEVE